MSTQQDINVFRTQRIANTHDPLALMSNTQTPCHPDHSSLITYIQHPQPSFNFVPQPSFNTNYMPQPMQNLEDSSDPTTAMNKALALLAKAFKVNTIPTNNNQRSSLIPRNSQTAQQDMNTSQDIKMQMVDDNVGNQVRQNVVQYDANEVGQNAVHNPGIQNVENMNGLSVVPEIANQYGNGNVVTAPAEGNGNGINGNPIRCVNGYVEGHHHASTCTVKPKKLDVAYLQKQIQIAQKEEVGIQLTQEEFDFMVDACANGSTEVPNDETCCDNDILNMLPSDVQSTDLQTELDRTKEKLKTCIIKKEKEYDVLWNNWYTKYEGCKYDKISYDKAYTDMQTKIERLQALLGDLKGKSSNTQCASNTLDPVSQKLEDEKVSLEFQVQNYAKENEHLKTTYRNLLDSITGSEQKDTTKGTRTNTKFTKQSILGKPPSSSKPKLYSLTPFPKFTVLPKKDESNALLKPVNSNSAPPPRESKVVQTVKGKVQKQKKHKANVMKSNKVKSKGSLASSRTRKPRTYLRWLPTGRTFKICGYISSSSNTESKSDTSVCENASTSNPQEPTCKRFPSSTSSLSRISNLRRQNSYTF
ncbi:hypothetical protein Tco_1353976 [Tanacetum coccineum]